MIKCLYSSVSRWKVNMGENADTAPTLCPSLSPPFLSIQLWVRCLFLFVKGCAVYACTYRCVCVCVSSAVPPVVEGKRHSTLSARQPPPPMWHNAVWLHHYFSVWLCLHSTGQRGGFPFLACVPLGSLGPVGCSIFGISGGFTNHSA